MWKATYTGWMLAWDELAQLDRLGGSIRARRVELGWTQSDLAERSGVPQADISRIENDRLDARWSTLQRLLTALADGGTPRRSLANGRRVKDTPTPSKRWTPRKPAARIQRSST
jgi:transcriptional regulator with XRE-family HTH domain